MNLRNIDDENILKEELNTILKLSKKSFEKNEGDNYDIGSYLSRIVNISDGGKEYDFFKDTIVLPGGYIMPLPKNSDVLFIKNQNNVVLKLNGENFVHFDDVFFIPFDSSCFSKWNILNTSEEIRKVGVFYVILCPKIRNFLFRKKLAFYDEKKDIFHTYSQGIHEESKNPNEDFIKFFI